MKRQRKWHTALFLSVIMTLSTVLTGAGLVAAEEGTPEEVSMAEGELEPMEETPQYHVTIPLTDGYILEYDQAALNAENQDPSKVVLDFAENDNVTIFVHPAEGQEISGIQVTTDTGTEQESFISTVYENQQLSFIMPPKDCDVAVTMAEPVVPEPTEPVQDPTAETPSEAPVQEPSAETPEEEPVQEPTVESSGEEPVQEPAVESPGEEPVQEEAAGEPAEEDLAQLPTEPDGTFSIQSIVYQMEPDVLFLAGNTLADTVGLKLVPADGGTVLTKSVILTQTFVMPRGLTVPATLSVAGNQVTDAEGRVYFSLEQNGDNNANLTFAKAEGNTLTVALTAENTAGVPVTELLSDCRLILHGDVFRVMDAFSGETPIAVHAQAIFSAAEEGYGDVTVETDAEIPIQELGIMALADTGLVPDQFVLQVEGLETLTKSPVHQAYLDNGSTWKRIKFLDGAETVTRIAYCIEPWVTTPVNGQVYDKNGDNVEELGDGNRMTRGLFVLYGGPMWGRDITLADDNGTEYTVNIKEIMAADGCATDANFYFMCHMILSYLYDPDGYNYSPEGIPMLNERGTALVERIAAIIMKLPSTKTRFSKSSVSADDYTVGVGSVSPSIKYTAFPENTATVKLPNGVSIVNETQNTTDTGTVTLNGGDTFHFLIADNYKGDNDVALSFQSRYAVDYTGYRLYLPDTQNVAFAYFSGDNSIPFNLHIPERVGSLSLQKVSEAPAVIQGNSNYSLEGAEYGLYTDKNCINKIATLTTKADGSSNVVKDIPMGTYYLREDKASKGHLIDSTYAKGKAVTIKAGVENTVKSTEPLIFGKITVQKTDAETGEKRPQSSSLTFAGAKYGIYTDQACGDDSLEATLTTDKNGAATSENLPLGTYYVKELTAPEGYLLDETVHTVELTQDNTANGVVTETVTSAEQIIRGDVSFYKFLGDGLDDSFMQDIYDKGELAGIIFELRYESDPEVGTVSVVTDRYGKATTMGLGADGKGALIYGEWKITEILPEHLEGKYNELLDGQVSITSDNYTEEQSYVVYNGQKYDRVRVVKIDAGTGNEIPRAGAKFKLLDEDGNQISMPDHTNYGTITDVFTTDKEGRIFFTKHLPVGTYTLTEIEPPEGYILAEPIIFKTNGESDDDEPLVIQVEEPQQMGKIRIVKTDAESGKVIGSGFEFEVKVAEDIKDASGEIRKGINADGEEVELTAGTIVDRLVTGKDSMAVSKELPVGKYVVTETKSGEYYAKDPAEYPAEIVGDTSGETITVNVGIKDDKTSFDLYKVDSENKDEPLEGITFRLYSSADIEAEKMEQIAGEVEKLASVQQEEVTQLVVSQEEALAELEAAQAEELASLKEQEGVTEEAIRELEETHTAALSALKETQAEELETLREAHAQAQKDLTDRLSGELQIENLGKLGKEYVTDENGQIHVENLTHNTTYYIFETATLPGYNLDPTVYEFHVDESGLINGKSAYTMILTNTANVVEISKKDITKKEELPGATLVVYDSEGNEIEKWTSTDEPHRIKGLPAGDYVLHEEAAPEGYSLAEDISFTLTDSLQVQKVEMFDDYIGIQISKKDITNEEELPGAVMAVMDSEGNEIEKWTSTKDPHVFNISAGVYTLVELSAPEHYATAKSIQFTVTSENKIQQVVMYDTPLQVQISKKDLINKEELAGATMRILDFDGNVVKEWITTDEPLILNLAKGKYTLTEVAAPKGYETAESINFTVEDTEEMQEVEMFDSPEDSFINLTGKKTSTSTPSSSGGSSTPSNPVGASGTAPSVKTGDETPIILFAVLAVLAAAGVGVLTYLKKKKHPEETNE